MTIRLRKLKASERGFTMVELLIVLGVIFALVAVIATAAYKVTQRSHVSRAVSEVKEIVAAAQSWRGTQSSGSYSGVSITALCTNDLLSHDMCNNNAANPWGGTYTIAATGTGSSEIQVTISSVPTGDDQDLADNLRPLSVNQSTSTASGGSVTSTFR